MPPKRRRASAAHEAVEIPSSHDPDVAITGSQVSPSRRRTATQRVRGSSSGARVRGAAHEPLVPDVFQAMLAEETKRGWASGSSDSGRGVKRRKGKERDVADISDGTSKEEGEGAENVDIQNGVESAADDASGGDEDEDEESDVDWEDVDLSAKRPSTPALCNYVYSVLTPAKSYELGGYNESPCHRSACAIRKAGYAGARAGGSSSPQGRRPAAKDYSSRTSNPA
jgi:hypothetical protein